MRHARHTKHHWRVLFLLVGAFFAFLIIRALLVPHSFGDFGFYRGDDVAEQMAKDVVFAEKGSCKECHAKAFKEHASGSHGGVDCQNCHAPLPVHIKDGEFVELMPIDRSPQLCLRCHERLPSRPKDFPQINVQEHTGKGKQHLESGYCSGCHRPHRPIGGR